MRLIDADALMKDLVNAIASQKRWMDGAKKSNSENLFQLAQQAFFTLVECKQHLEMAPTIETPRQPQRMRGRWVELTNTNHTYICSICGRMLVNVTDGKNTVAKNYPFCHCGADMREVDE